MPPYHQTDSIGGILVPYAPWFRCFSPALDELLAENATKILSVEPLIEPLIEPLVGLAGSVPTGHNLPFSLLGAVIRTMAV